MECEVCSGTGYECCDNCGEHDCGLNGNRVCVIDGVEYGAGPCRQGCTPPHGLDPDYVLGDAYTLVDGMDLGLLTEGTLADLGRRLDILTRTAATLREAKAALETALIEAMPEDTLTMDGIRVVRERKSRWAWKSKTSGQQMREDLQRTIAERMSTDPETGEINVGRRRLISEAIQELYDAVPAIQEFKVAGAKRLGLSIFDYKDRSDGYNISVVPLEEGL